MAELKRKQVVARYLFDEGGWTVEVEGVAQTRLSARTLGRAREHARSSIAELSGSPAAESAVVELREEFPTMPPTLVAVVAAANETRARAAALAERAQELTAHAAQRLVLDVGMSIRDAADLLNMSHQRVHQLLAE